MAVPDPGGAICTACGPVGSPAYAACNAQVTAGLIPACAAPKGGTLAPQQSGGSTVAATQSTNQTAASSDPWYCWLVPDQYKSAASCSGGATGINWGDIGIRAGLIIFGVILVLLVIAKMIESPEVVIEK